MKQSCRIFLKSPKGTLKKIYSIWCDRKEKFIQAQIMCSQMCHQYGIPLNSEIHHHYPENGKDLHLSIKYKDLGPFDDPNIVEIENYLTIFHSKEEYKHKQVICKINQPKLTHTHSVPLTKENRIMFMLGYLPDSFTDYLQMKAKYPIYYFSTVSTPITPTPTQDLEEKPWLKGDNYKKPPTNNDIVIEESYETNARINVCGFICSQGHYPVKNDGKHRSKVITNPLMPDFGISVIFS